MKNITEETKYKAYLKILKEELVPAMGCTEPIALAYCAAKARAILGRLPERAEVELSGNIIKNVKSVIVPNTGGEKGIETAVAMGFLAGDEKKGLEVFSGITEEQKMKLPSYRESTDIQIKKADNNLLLDITIRVYGGDDNAMVRITGSHTNIVHIERNKEVLLDRDETGGQTESEMREESDRSMLTVKDIFDFAETVKIEDVKDVLDVQIRYNLAISEEGLKKDYGANIGSVLLSACGDSVRTRARAAAAAGSDARMGGCEMPVVINSGSGNQGITVSVPVVIYARELGVTKEKLYRALVISNLIAIHLKTGIGCLSAYCGAVSAGAAAGAGIAYLHGGSCDDISHTVVNALAITSGIICDGAKASCAAKISTAVDAGIFGYDMYMKGQQFYGGDGVISKGIENTIRNIGVLGHDGMRETDKEILKIMTCM